MPPKQRIDPGIKYVRTENYIYVHLHEQVFLGDRFDKSVRVMFFEYTYIGDSSRGAKTNRTQKVYRVPLVESAKNDLGR